MTQQRVPSGILHVVRGQPNPNGAAASALYLFRGAPAAVPIRGIIAAPGMTLPGPPDLPPERPFHLLLLHFNDLHGHLAEVNRDAIRPVFSRMAGHIQRARAACIGWTDTGVLVFSGGDDLVGTAFAELMGCRPKDFRCHPAFRLYSEAGVDAAAVGNHDLDWGLGLLSRAAGQDAAFPLLAANLVPAAGAACVGAECAGIYPAALFVVNNLRVGVIGLTTSAEIKHVLPGEFTITDPIATVGNLLPVLRPLCDVLIVLSHLGHSLTDRSAVTAGAGDVELAQALPHGAVDLIIGGHTHSVLNEHGLDAANCVNGIPIVQAGVYGRHLGEVCLAVGRDGVAVTDARLCEVSALPEDAGFEAEHVLPLARQVQVLLRQPIGEVGTHPDFSTARVCATFAKEELALANFVTDALVARCRAAGFGVDFAMVDASTMCEGLPQNDILTFDDLFRLAPHADSIVLYRLTPAQLQVLLDDNARRADRPDEPYKERGFLQFSREVRYGIISGETRFSSHAAGATLSGIPIEAFAAVHTQPLLVACSSFVRQLASHWEQQVAARGASLFDLCSLPVEQTGLALREELVAYVREMGGVSKDAGLARDARVVLLRE